MKRYDNLEKRIFEGVGEYGIPELAPTQFESGCEFISFNYAKSCKDRGNKGIHFLLTIINLIAFGEGQTFICRCYKNFDML